MRRFIVTLSSVLLLAAPALAQIYEVPTIKTLSEQSMVYEWLYGLAFLVGCLVVGFKPAKRSNLR